MKIKYAFFTLLLVVTVLATGCGAAQSLVGRNAGTVSDLWPDVPPLPNATKVNLDIPLPMQLIIQGFVQAANADSSSDVKLDKFDFIAYQSADTPQQIGEYYTNEKMKAAGWNAEDTPGCTTGSGDAGGAAGFCVFGKKDGAKATVLMIIPARDESANQTQVYYVRFEGTKK